MEVLLTIILITAGFAGLMEVFSRGLFAGDENETEFSAVTLAQEKMECIRNTAFSSIVNEAKAPVPGFPVFRREVVVTTPRTNLKQVAVNVYWFTKNMELNTGLVTYVSNI